MTTWQEWQQAPWGRLRYSIAEENLVRHLSSPEGTSVRVLDLAGGDGGDAIRLAARGHHVTVVDFAPAMLAAATERAAALGLCALITCIEADVADLPDGLAAGEFDVVVCHNLLQYTDDVPELLAKAVGALRAGGVLSIMAINRHSVPLRVAVREADPAAALAALKTDRSRTEMFDSALTLHTADEIVPILTDLGCQDVAHYGIRTFCDYITDDERKHDPDFFAELERLERATTALPPYVHIARLFQLIAQRGDPARPDPLDGDVSPTPATGVATATHMSISRPALRTAWFGDSLIEHPEAYHPRLTDQTDLPAIGTSVTIAGWRTRGYVHAVTTWMATQFASADVSVENHGKGGATSADVLAAVIAVTNTGQRWDLAALSCGINDVWRAYQGRLHEAVGIDDYERNLHAALHLLRAHTAVVLIIGMPPLGWDRAIDVVAANGMLFNYNARARRAAEAAGAGFVDLWNPFHHTAAQLGWTPAHPTPPAGPTNCLWTDGIHLSELGVELARQTIIDHLTSNQIVEHLLDS